MQMLWAGKRLTARFSRNGQPSKGLARFSLVLTLAISCPIVTLVGMPSIRLSLFLFFSLGAAVLFFVFTRDVTYTYTRIHVQQSFPDHPPRPPYPPFHPPDLSDVATPLSPPPPPPPPPQLDNEAEAGASQLLWASRAISIREAFLHAYHSYEKYASFPADELQPISNKSVKK